MIHYKGLSLFNNQPVISILTGYQTPSLNIKTGPVIQQTIMADLASERYLVNPTTSETVCGTCSLQTHKQGGCYVNRLFATHMIHKHKDQYPEPNYLWLTGRVVRLGADGDPTCIPFDAYDLIFRNADTVLGYTHAWRTCDERWKNVLLASVESLEVAEEARDMGWRTFRIRPEGGDAHGDVVCPYERNKIQCVSCKLCSSKYNRNIVVTVHGSRKSRIFN